jgi:RNA polymerase sigma-70 factor (ECF subfamily)
VLVSLTPHEPSNDSIDADLAVRIRSGDHAAFDALFTAYYGQLCSFAYSYVRSREAAEEVVQDVFAAIWARRREWTVAVSPRSYLFGAVRNRAQRRRAQGRAEQSRWSLLARLQRHATPGDGTPARDVERGEVETLVRRAIAQLPERSRVVAHLRWQQQMSYPEIAAVMGISVKGVENQLGRVTKRLRSLLASLRAEA